MAEEVPHSDMQESEEVLQTSRSRSEIAKFYTLCILLTVVLNFILFGIF